MFSGAALALFWGLIAMIGGLSGVAFILGVRSSL